MEYLPYYKEFMTAGHLPKHGLCNSLPFHMTWTNTPFDMIEPTGKEEAILSDEGYDIVYWGSGMKLVDLQSPDKMEMRLKLTTDMTPLRETVLLLCAAINNEL